MSISIAVLSLDLDHKFSIGIRICLNFRYENSSCDSFIYIVMFVTICIIVAQLIAPNSLRYLVSKLCWRLDNINWSHVGVGFIAQIHPCTLPLYYRSPAIYNWTMKSYLRDVHFQIKCFITLHFVGNIFQQIDVLFTKHMPLVRTLQLLCLLCFTYYIYMPMLQNFH